MTSEKIKLHLSKETVEVLNNIVSLNGGAGTIVPNTYGTCSNDTRCESFCIQINCYPVTDTMMGNSCPDTCGKLCPVIVSDNGSCPCEIRESLLNTCAETCGKLCPVIVSDNGSCPCEVRETLIC